jgi:microcystin-dependent protein
VYKRQAGTGAVSHPTGPLTSTDSEGTSLVVNSTITVDYTGGNLAHSNYQPSIGCYFIMYIP